jgi:hypothetical protein
MTLLQRKRLQKGAVALEGKQWVLRYRVTEVDNTGEHRVMKYAILGLARKKDTQAQQNGHKPAPPRAILRARDAIIDPLNDSVERGAEILFRKPITIRQFVEEDYFMEIGSPPPIGLKWSTVRGYRELWRNHLAGLIGAMKLGEFKRSHATNLWLTIIRSHPELTKGTLDNIRNFVRSIFHKAQDRGFYEFDNPGKASLPRNVKNSEIERMHTACPRSIAFSLFCMTIRTRN